MKRRTVLQSLLGVPAAAALPMEARSQQAPAGAQANRETPVTTTVGADATADAVIRTFNPAQFAALRRLGDILMPAANGTLGASVAGASEFLDFLIGASPADRVALYREGLDRLNQEAKQRHDKLFSEVTAEQAEPILAPLKMPWTYNGPKDSFARFLLAAKNDLMLATVNSREYSAAAAQHGRRAGGAGRYWYPVE
jgi:hypothetical protein